MDALKQRDSGTRLYYGVYTGFISSIKGSVSEWKTSQAGPCLKTQDTIDVGFVYIQSLSCETFLHCLQELQWEKDYCMLHSGRFCCLPQALLASSTTCWAAAVPARERGSSVTSQRRWHAALNGGLLFCFSLGMCHALPHRPDKGKSTEKKGGPSTVHCFSAQLLTSVCAWTSVAARLIHSYSSSFLLSLSMDDANWCGL